MKPRRIHQQASVACVTALAVFITGCEPGSTVSSSVSGTDASPEPDDATVQAVCGSCHLFPDPSVLPRPVWRKQIEHMAFLADYLASNTTPFEVEAFIGWYESRAPEELRMEPAITRAADGPLRFDFRAVRLGRESGPGVATVSRIGRLLAVPNMANGSVHLLSWEKGPRLIGNAGNPARVSAGDLDGDGKDDLVVSDLGNPLPTDEPTGRVLIGLGLASDELPEESAGLELLVEGIGRVADARPIDIDLDGDLDLVVAAFGYLKEGGVYVLRNETRGQVLAFESEQATDRAGAVSVVPVYDLVPGTGPGFVGGFGQ
jgi:hypothetical protein